MATTTGLNTQSWKIPEDLVDTAGTTIHGTDYFGVLTEVRNEGKAILKGVLGSVQYLNQ